MEADYQLPCNLTEEQWQDLVEVRNLLHPFKSVQKMLEGEKYVTSSWLLAAVEKLLSWCLRIHK